MLRIMSIFTHNYILEFSRVPGTWCKTCLSLKNKGMMYISLRKDMLFSVLIQNNLQSMKRCSDSCVLPCDFVFELCRATLLLVCCKWSWASFSFPICTSSTMPCNKASCCLSVMKGQLSSVPGSQESLCNLSRTSWKERTGVHKHFPPNHENNPNKEHI